MLPVVVALANPHAPLSSRWWVHEASISAEDGHDQAAAAAYAQAIETAPNEAERRRLLALAVDHRQET